MAAVQACPSCGETEALRGAPATDDIEVTCLTCGATWLRGARRCASCAGLDVVELPQVMTRRPRGNQVAIVGRRQVPLCRRCDSVAVEAYLETNRPVAEDYASAAVLGAAPDRTDEPTRRPARPPRERPAATPPVASTPTAPTTTARAPAPERPTVRQAVEAFLSTDPDVDQLTLVMLGRFLGPARRVADVGRGVSATDLGTWFDDTWGERQGSRDAASATVRAIFAHWLSQEWIDSDPAADLP